MRRFLTILCAMALGTALFAAPVCPDEWKAHWISKEHIHGGTNSWTAFRKTVEIDRVPASLTARIATDTKYWLWINGDMVVFEGGLKRGPTPDGTYYDKVEIAPYLREGTNVISVLTWYMGKSGFSHISSGVVALLFEAVGEGIEILSDNSWECSAHQAYGTASCPEPNYRLPESSVSFDARKFPYDWYRGERPAYLGHSLELPFEPGKAPFGALVERPIPLWKDYGLKEYEEVSMRGDTLVCRLPYNCHATPWLKVNAPEGKLIRMETDHARVTGVDCVRAEYVTRSGVQEYEHLCWMNGEKMYYVIPEGVEVLAVKYRETGYDTEFSGYFRCDDELLDEYWQKAVRTMYVCMRDTYYDCPDRERAQWWGDEVNELAEAFCMFSPSAWDLAFKGIGELVGWQKPTGEMYAPVPASNWVSELPMQILASVGWYGFYRQGFYSGDFSFVPDIYDRLHVYLHDVWKLDSDGLPIYRKGGWDWPDAGDNADSNALVHPWYYLALKAEREFALMLGRQADADADEALMARITEAFNARCWNGSEYRSPGYEGLTDDRVAAMAVVSGLAGEDKYPAVLRTLREQSHATTYMHRYVLEALCMLGHPEMALELMHRRYPTIMRDDCSTLWEHWDFDGTCNHAWAGCGTIVMVGKFAGIEPLEPGFRKFRVVPQMGALKHIEAGFDTASGRIELVLDRKGRRIEMDIMVPDGTEAEVCSGGKVIVLAAGRHKVKL